MIIRVDGMTSGGEFPGNGLAGRLREAVGQPLEGWREVYESFSPVDLESGERAPRVPSTDEASRRAAVLVPVVVEGDLAQVVYTVRRADLADHAGQISFPGGSLEPGDACARDAALREAGEEIDLPPDLVEVIGELEEMYIPPSNFRVSPFVGLLGPEARFTLDPEEVEEIFTVTLEELMSADAFEKVIWRREDGRDYEVPVFAVGRPRREIWGATAAMTAVLLARLGWREPDPRHDSRSHGC